MKCKQCLKGKKIFIDFCLYLNLIIASIFARRSDLKFRSKICTYTYITGIYTHEYFTGIRYIELYAEFMDRIKKAPIIKCVPHGIGQEKDG